MDNKEIRIFFDWSVRNEGNYSYTKVDKNIESYFVKYDRKEYIKEYGFETIVELKEELTQMWLGAKYMEEVIKPVAVAAMKNQPKDDGNKNKTEVLNEFIYIF